MRHLGSFLLTLVFAPAIFLLTGSGLSAFASTVDIGAQHRPVGALAALGAFVLAGVLYAVLTLARISPLGPMLAGLTGLGVGAWVLVDTASYDAQFSMVDVHMAGEVGKNGFIFLLAMPLLATAFSGRRWRGYSDEVAEASYPGSERTPTYRPPASADQTRVLPPSQGGDETRTYAGLPDVPSPSLRYPKSVTPVSVPPASQPAPTQVTPPTPVAPQTTTAPAPSVPASELPVPPLPRRNAQQGGGSAIAAAAADPGAAMPAAEQPDGDERTVFLGDGDDIKTVNLHPEDPDATKPL